MSWNCCWKTWLITGYAGVGGRRRPNCSAMAGRNASGCPGPYRPEVVWAAAVVVAGMREVTSANWAM